MTSALFLVRGVYFLAALQLFGWLNFACWFGERPRARWLVPLTAATIVSLVAWLAIETQALSDGPLSFDTMRTVLSETRFGELWIARIVLLIVIAAILPWRIGATILAAMVLVLTAGAGHGGAEGNALHFAGDAIHLLAAGAWLGGLLPFAAALRRPDAGQIAGRFSTLGTVCVGLLLATGGINGWFLVGNGKALIGTDYGILLLVKIALFVAMVSIAAINRYRLTPRLGEAGMIAVLRRNALIETAVGIAIVTVVAILGTLPPAYYAAAS